MNTINNTYHIEIGGFSIEVIRKDIKHFYIGVHPPNGQIRVSAPLRLDDDAVRMAIISRLGWIRRKQADFVKQNRQSQREFVSGESHYFAGKRYRLKVTEQDCPPKVQLAQQYENRTPRCVRTQIVTNVRRFYMNGIESISANKCHQFSPNGSRRWMYLSMKCESRK